MNDYTMSHLNESAEYVRSQIPGIPKIAIVLGSGLGPLAELIENPKIISYDKIPHFAKSTVEGHAGELIYGKLKGKKVICMKGRFHYYEGYPFDVVTYPIRLFKTMGINTLILTNAAGGVNEGFVPGDLMIITDHVNFMGSNPLIGPNIEELGTRFPDLSEAYSKRLIKIAQKAGNDLAIKLQKGVYGACTGPSYETPAEVRMLRTCGADAVGMSTVPETIIANHMGMEVLAISCITNAAAGVSDEKLSHDEVTEVATLVKNTFTSLIAYIVENIDLKLEEMEKKEKNKNVKKIKKEALADYIDHTLLKPDATEEQITKLCQEAIEYDFKTVCLNSCNVELAAKLLKDKKTLPIAVVGFPLGATVSTSKAFETSEAIKAGAREIDTVINIGALKAKDYKTVFEDIKAVVDAAKPCPVKVILETSELDNEEKIIACGLSKAAEAAFVKTSTGFAKGGATVEDIKLMRRIVGNKMGVKASGGVRTKQDAEAMIAAGADRIGASSSIEIVTG